MGCPMFLLKKVILGILFIALMYYGGAGTQSDSTSLQGMGFMGIVLGFIILYILFKIMWTAMSFVMAFTIIGGVVLFILYCLGFLGEPSAMKEVGEKLLSENEISTEYPAAADNLQLSASASSDGGGNTQLSDTVPQDSAKMAMADIADNTASPEVENNGGFFSDITAKVSDFFGGEAEPAQITDFNPEDYPLLTGRARVITGSVLRVKGIDVKLLGIDAPNPEQTCSNSRGIAYSCGKKAITWLQDWLHDQVVECRILGNVVNRRATGICFLGKYDIAAAVVSAGWAVAYTKNTRVYEAYEKQARDELQGMWDGRFYRPSDWRKMQKRRTEVKFKKNSSGWFDFDGWF